MHQVIGAHLRRRAGIGTGGQGESAAAQNFEAEVAAAFGPFVGLFGQDGADEADDGIPVGEDPDDVGAAADLAVEPFCGVVRPDLAPHVVGERGEGEQVLAGIAEVLSDLGQAVLRVLQQPVELGVDGVCGGLVIDAAGAWPSRPATWTSGTPP